MLRRQGGSAISSSFMSPCVSFPQLNAGQKPTPMWAAIMLRTVSGLSLSKVMRGVKPASLQKRSQIWRNCLLALRLMKFASRKS